MVKRALIPLLLVALPVTYSLRSSAQQPKAPKAKASASAPPIDTALDLSAPTPAASPKKPVPAPSASIVPLPPPMPAPVAGPVVSASVAVAPAAPPPSASVAPTSTAAPSGVGAAAIHHAPLSVAKPHEPVDVEAEIASPHLIKRVVLVYRHGDKVEELAFLRGAGEGYVARIPAEHVNPPGLAYAIEIEGVDGKTVNAFASRAALHPIQIPDDIDDERERLLLERVGGRRSVALGSFDYVYYGRSLGEADLATGAPAKDVRDEYLRSEIAYLYRPLRHVFEFGIKIGFARGRSPKGGPDGTKVGINYGAPTATFRLHDLFHVESWFLTSVTEEGFSPGIGGAFHIGDPLGSKLVVGGESIKTFGSRGWARLDIVQSWFRVSPVVEVGDIPNARAGVRLYTEFAIRRADGFGLAVRGGYQARDFNSGGFGGGLSFGYAF